MRRASRVHGTERDCIQYFDGKVKNEEINYSESLDVDGRIIIKWVLNE
jgi:hypothetical protein